MLYVRSALGERPHGWLERNALYLEHAVRLLESAARDALDAARLAPDAIDAVLCVSTTGIDTPSLDAILMGGWGCGRMCAGCRSSDWAAAAA